MGSHVSDEERQPFRLLIVDDNEDAVRALDIQARWEGHVVSVAYNGKDGLNTAISFHPDLLLLDIGLPQMDGFEVCRAIRGLGLEMKIVAMSGYAGDDTREEARKVGFDEFLPKPVRYDTVQAIIREHQTT